MNLAYVPSAPTRASVAFDFVTSAANVFGGVWETGAGAIFAENEALAWLVELLGWPRTAGGCFVSGGTIGNLSALVAARETALARRGSRPSGGWQLACTGEAHSSIRSAARVLDVTLVEVPGDDRGRLTGARLEPILRAHPDVFAVVATAGTTNAGLIDDLAGVADACAAHGVWMHVDGAYGGAGLAAPSVRELFDGVERADSFIVDPHKWLFAPYDCCALLYRDPALARAAHAQSANYLDQIDHEMWNPADLGDTPVASGSRSSVLVQPGHPRHRPLCRGSGADLGHLANRGRRPSGRVRTWSSSASPSCRSCLFQRPGWDSEPTASGHSGMAHEGVILCSADHLAWRTGAAAWRSSTLPPRPSASSRCWRRCASPRSPNLECQRELSTCHLIVFADPCVFVGGMGASPDSGGSGQGPRVGMPQDKSARPDERSARRPKACLVSVGQLVTPHLFGDSVVLEPARILLGGGSSGYPIRSLVVVRRTQLGRVSLLRVAR